MNGRLSLGRERRRFVEEEEVESGALRRRPATLS